MPQTYEDERYAQADHVSLLGYLQSTGYPIVKCGREYRSQEHDSLKINPDKNCFFWNSQKKAGGPVQWMMYVENMTRSAAIDALLGESYIPAPKPLPLPEKPKGELVLPERAENHRRVFAYLTKTRGLDAQTISRLMHEHKIYESLEHHNCVFVAYDRDGKATNGTMRGTVTDAARPFKIDLDNIDKTCPYAIAEGTSGRVYVYESFIDAASDLTLQVLKGQPDKGHHRVALGGVYDQPLYRYLEDHPEINTVIFRTDNDEAGHNAVRQMGGELLTRGLYVHADFPLSKDVNQDLLDFRARALETRSAEGVEQ